MSVFRSLLVDLVLIFCVSVAVSWIGGIFTTGRAYPLDWTLEARKFFAIVFVVIAGVLTYLRFVLDWE